MTYQTKHTVYRYLKTGNESLLSYLICPGEVQNRKDYGLYKVSRILPVVLSFVTDKLRIVLHVLDGTAEPVLIFDPSVNTLQSLADNTFIWQGIQYNDITELLSVYIISLGGDVPRDSPVPNVRKSSLVEFIIAGVVSSIGILSTIFFFMFNLYYRKQM